MIRIAASLLLIILLAAPACSSYYEGLIKKVLPEDVDAFARTCIEEAVNNDVDGIIARIAPEDRTEGMREEFQRLSKYMRKGGLVKVSTAGVEANTAEGSTAYNITYELQHASGWQAAGFLLVKQGDTILLKGLDVNNLPDSIAAMNRFTFQGKTATHYLFFFLNIAYLIVIGSALVLCIRTRPLRRKWLWLIITLLGVAGFSFNWTTGAYEISPLSFGFNVSTFVSPFPYIPSILKFYVPAGAIFFLLKRRRLSTLEPAAPLQPETAGPLPEPGGDQQQDSMPRSDS